VSTEALPINATHFYDNTDTLLALVSFFVPTAQLKLPDYQYHSLPSVGELQDLLATHYSLTAVSCVLKAASSAPAQIGILTASASDHNG
jgi:hypothetical protein